MKPFHQLRIWSRRAPASERVLAAAAAVLALGLLAWALVPTNQPRSLVANGLTGTAGASTGMGVGSSVNGSRLAGSGSIGAPGGTSGPGAGEVAGGAGRTGVTGGSTAAKSGVNAGSSGVAAGSKGGGTSDSTASSCAAPTSPQPGVTASQITVGVVMPDLGELDSALGIPSVADLEKMYDAVIAGYNSAGGVLCRKLVPKFYEDDVVDPSAEQATCLQIQQDGDFAVLNNIDNPQEFNCLAQRSVPNIFYTSPHTPAMHQFFPYVMAMVTDYNRLIEDYIFGAQKLGLLTGQKVGLLLQTCYPEENTDIVSDLASVGLKAVSTYNYGCIDSGTAPDTPNQDEEAALQFRSAGVTLVLETARDVVTDFAQEAQSQGYTPKYVMMNDQSMSLVADSSTSIPTSFNGTIAITTDQEGASNTPGYVPIPATVACTKITTAAGLAPPDDQHRLAGQLDGGACAVVEVLVAALDHMSYPLRTGLPYGLAKAGLIELSAPEGPMDVTNPQVPTGGQFWRPAKWYTACSCWRVTNLQWTPGWN